MSTAVPDALPEPARRHFLGSFGSLGDSGTPAKRSPGG